jgi:hypothetical protein
MGVGLLAILGIGSGCDTDTVIVNTTFDHLSEAARRYCTNSRLRLAFRTIWLLLRYIFRT